MDVLTLIPGKHTKFSMNTFRTNLISLT